MIGLLQISLLWLFVFSFLYSLVNLIYRRLNLNQILEMADSVL